MFQEEIEDERAHAPFLTHVNVDLGEEPTTTPMELDKPEHLKGMLKLDLEMELQDIGHYAKHAK